jgi:DNA replication and repair protein RecF
VYVSHLTLHGYRSYDTLEVPLEAGVTSFVGRNGQGKTNIVEAVDYLSRLTSHRVASDTPLVKQGAEQAVIRAAVVKEGREALIEVEINPGRSNRARVNRSPLPRSRDLVGIVRTVLFSPEDLALVKGEPTDRRRFLDDLMVLRTPRMAGVKADYDRVLRQRNALLKNAAADRRRGGDYFDSTLSVWNEQLVRLGAELTAFRAALVDDLVPLLAQAYAAVAKDGGRNEATLTYQPSVPVPRTDTADTADAGDTAHAGDAAETGDELGAPGDGDAGGGRPTREALERAFLGELDRRRPEEVQRGITLVGPHRDELGLSVGTLPVKGYASHGESWSFALAMRLASYDLLRADGDDPILILDDVFAELDTDRRERLAELVAGAEQVLVTAAVDADVPVALRGARVEVRREEQP